MMESITSNQSTTLLRPIIPGIENSTITGSNNRRNVGALHTNRNSMNNNSTEQEVLITIRDPILNRDVSFKHISLNSPGGGIPYTAPSVPNEDRTSIDFVSFFRKNRQPIMIIAIELILFFIIVIGISVGRVVSIPS